MSRYDGLIIPRSYSEYINKTDAATLQQALQLSGVLSKAVVAGVNKAVTSDAVNTAIREHYKSLFLGVSDNRNKYDTLENIYPTGGVVTAVYLITLRNGESHILICGTSDRAEAVEPVWIQINSATNKLQSISYDLSTKKIVLERGTYTSLIVTQIGGRKTEFKTNIATESLENNVMKKTINYT